MKKIRFAASFILSLVFMLMLVILQFSLFARNILLNEKFYRAIYERTGIYEYVEDSINKSLGNIGRTVNLPEELFSSLTSKVWIKEQVDYTTDSTIEYMMFKTEKLPVIDAEKQVEAFNKAVDDYIKKLNLVLEKNALNEIGNIKKNVESIVKSQASFIDFTSISKSSAFQKGRTILYYAYKIKNVLILALLINMILIYLFNIKNFYSFIRWTGYSFIAGGLMTLVPAAVGVFSRFADSIAMSEAVLKSFTAEILETSMKYFIVTGTIALAVGIMITIASMLLENRKITKHLSN